MLLRSHITFLSTATIITLLCVSSYGQSLLQGYQDSSSPKALAVYFNNLPSDTSNIDPIKTEFSQRIATVLGVQATEIQFGPLTADTLNPSGSFLPFTISGGEFTVTDSVSTPEAYSTFSNLWKNALANDANLKNAFNSNDIEITVNVERYEVAIISDGEDDDDYEESDDPNVSSSTERNDMIKALEGRYEVMQLRLKNVNINDYTQLWSKLNHLVEGTRTVVAAILGVPENRVILFSIKQGSVVAQFTVHPASSSDLDNFSKKWTSAIENKHPSLAGTFTDFDFEYPATELTGVTTTSTTAPPHKDSDNSNNEDDGPSAGLVAGAVLGSLAGVALVGGGAAGYMYKQKQKKDAPSQVMGAQNRRGEDFGEVSPGGDMMSPSGLSNVDIHGEATPNPHNFH